MATIYQGSREYLTVPLRVLNVGSVAPTMVEIAVVAMAAAPVSASWKPATFIDNTARILLDGTLDRGRYSVWVRVTDNPERVVRRAGELEVL